MKELRIKLRRYLLRMQKKELSDGFTLWHNFWQDEKRAREMAAFNSQLNALNEQKLRKFAQKLANGHMMKSWNHWYFLFCQLRQAKKTVGRIANRKMHSAFSRWEEMCEEAQRMRTMLKRCAMKIMHRQMAGAFDR